MTSLEAFEHLKGHFEHILRSIEIPILMEHIRRLEPAVFARHFKGFRPQSLGRRRITDALRFELFERQNAPLADVLVLLWNQSQRRLYHAMLAHVKTIADDVESIERIEDDKANEILDDMLGRFPLNDVLICVRLNDVRFSPEVIAKRLECCDSVAESSEGKS